VGFTAASWQLDNDIDVAVDATASISHLPISKLRSSLRLRVLAGGCTPRLCAGKIINNLSARCDIEQASVDEEHHFKDLLAPP